MNLIGQNNIDITKQPSSGNGMMYGCSVGESSQEVHGTPSHVEDANSVSEPCTLGEDKSAGKEKALVVGCNANNANASARTANCNNAVSNSNDNYAGAFAVKQVETTNMRKSQTQKPLRIGKKTKKQKKAKMKKIVKMKKKSAKM